MIPKIIHFIWIGRNQISDESKLNIKKWTHLYRDYDIVLWNDKMVDDLNLIPSYLHNIYYNTNLNTAFKADILRYLIINKFGGLYFDVDFECLKKLPDIFLNFNFLGAIQNNGEVAIGFFGSQPNVQILFETLESIPISVQFAKQNNFYSNSNIYKITGPEFFNNICKKYFSEQNYFFFTKEYFYPYWFTETDRRKENFSETSPLAYAVHHWEKSWI